MALGLLTVAASLAVERLLPAVCASGVGAHRLPCSVEHLLPAVCALGVGAHSFLALRHVGSSQTRGKTYVPSTAPAGKWLDSTFLKELNLVSEGSTEVANGAMVVGESFKSCCKGSPRMAGKSTRGKRNNQKKETRPRIRAAGERVGWCWASGDPLLFHISCCPQTSLG